jgi:putative endopeptidase
MITNKIRKGKAKNKTTKIRTAIIREGRNIEYKQKPSGSYTTFEDKIEDLFKKKNIDILSKTFNLEKTIVSQLKEHINPKGIKPNDDFYSYINDRWIEDYELLEEQKYIIEIDDYRVTQDKIYRELIQLIDDYITNPATKDTKKAKCMKNAYTSFKIYNTDEQIKVLAKTMVEYVDKNRQDKYGVWEMLGLLSSSEITVWGSPFVWSIYPDELDPKLYKSYIEPPRLSIIDMNVYIDYITDTEKDKKYKNNYRKNYFTYLNNLFTICFGDNHGFNIKDIYEVEIEIIHAMACHLVKSDNSNDYNIVSTKQALTIFNFDWELFGKSLGFKNVPEYFITSNINYLLCGTKLLNENWDSEKWRTYWIYLFIRQPARWNKKGSHNFYEFDGKFVRGQEAPIDEHINPIFCMGYLFDTFLTNEYISKYADRSAIDYVKNMAEDLKSVFIRIIKRNDWMQSTTKKKALEKLNNFKFIIGSIEQVMEDKLLDYKPDDPWGNLVKFAAFRQTIAVTLFGKDVINCQSVIDWTQHYPKFVGTQVFIANASYTPITNSIYIPLGYIQQPFVDLDQRGLEYNLSRIGFALSHEMSHALDDVGSNYDELGRLNNWWTEKDAEAFKKIQKDVKEQYEAFAKYDGINIDGELTIGEDLADISGLAICEEYLSDFQLKNADILPVQSLSYTSFFIYFAVQARQRMSKKAVLAQLKTNPHPLDKYRCNIPLSRSNVFRAIYNVKKGDKMWWKSTNSVWENK